MGLPGMDANPLGEGASTATHGIAMLRPGMVGAWDWRPVGTIDHVSLKCGVDAPRVRVRRLRVLLGGARHDACSRRVLLLTGRWCVSDGDVRP